VHYISTAAFARVRRTEVVALGEAPRFFEFRIMSDRRLCGWKFGGLEWRSWLQMGGAMDVGQRGVAVG